MSANSLKRMHDQLARTALQPVKRTRPAPTALEAARESAGFAGSGDRRGHGLERDQFKSKRWGYSD